MLKNLYEYYLFPIMFFYSSGLIFYFPETLKKSFRKNKNF